MATFRAGIAAIVFAVLTLQAQAQPLLITGRNFQQIQFGMTDAQVVQIVGRPEAFRAAGNQIVWSYINKCIQFLGCASIFAARADFHVIFTNGQVTEVGAGEVRQNNANALFIFGM